ncbi:LAFA_0F07184g1_1 [Lachancea sp. 'fantastica']|nr:LAFA_0F07184g1_1 [Lachancea sp. 'fantastica']
MIIYDGEKYSCVSCIRGHRSTTCKHSNRMLVKVRTKGRPSAKTVRKVILVDASSQVDSGKGPFTDHHHISTPEYPSGASSAQSPLPWSCTKMNKQPILFLRAKSTQKAFLVDGALKIVVEDQNASLPDGQIKLVSEKDYLLNHLKTSHPNDALGQLPQAKTNHCCGSAKNETNTEPELGWSPRTFTDNMEVKPQHHDLNLPIANNPKFSANKDPSATNLDFQARTEYETVSEFQNNSFVELLTPKGLYLSTQCNCESDCQCVNCLIHRKEEEIESYVKQSGVPLSNVGNGRISLPDEHFNLDTVVCKASSGNCNAGDCLDHPKEIVPFNKIILYGLLNVPLGPSSLIKYKHKLIPSKFWWSLVKEELPFMTSNQISQLDLIQWFEDMLVAMDAQHLTTYGQGHVNGHGMGLMTNA